MSWQPLRKDNPEYVGHEVTRYVDGRSAKVMLPECHKCGAPVPVTRNAVCELKAMKGWKPHCPLAVSFDDEEEAA